MTKHSISIITVVFNNCQTIADTLNSVREQTSQVLEHIIIDGGSTDGTQEIIENNLYSNLKYISEPDQGIYDAMNKGIDLASGDIVGFLNSDDVFFDESVINDIKYCFDKHPLTKILYGDLVYVKKENINKVIRQWVSKPYHSTFFEEGHVPPHPSFFVKRDVLVMAHGFDLCFQIAADYDLMFRLLNIEKIPSFYLSRNLVRMRLGGKSNQNFRNIILGNKEIFMVWKKHKKKIPINFWFGRYYNKIRQFFLGVCHKSFTY